MDKQGQDRRVLEWKVAVLCVCVHVCVYALRYASLRSTALCYAARTTHSFISFHFISFHFISFHFISFHFISFHFISFHFISFHFISFHFISFHFISFHFISFHFISFHPSIHPSWADCIHCGRQHVRLGADEIRAKGPEHQ